VIRGRSSLVSVKPRRARERESVTASPPRASPWLAPAGTCGRAGVFEESPRTVTSSRAAGGGVPPVRLPPVTRRRVATAPRQMSRALTGTPTRCGQRFVAADPNVATPIRSAASRILLVAWRDARARHRSRSYPSRRSLTPDQTLPAILDVDADRAGTASSAFSISSFNDRRGRSTFAAAIWSATRAAGWRSWPSRPRHFGGEHQRGHRPRDAPRARRVTAPRSAGGPGLDHRSGARPSVRRDPD